MRGQFSPNARPSLSLDVRRILIAACLIATIPVGWRVGEAAWSLQRATAAYQRGVELQKANRLDEAAAAFGTAISLHPRMLDAQRRLAAVELRRGQIDNAIAVYRKVMAVYPFSRAADLYREIGAIELGHGRLEEARRDLAHALTLDPRDWRAHELLGELYRRQGEASQAEASYRRARELKQDPRARL